MTASTATKKRCWSFHVTGVNRKKGSKIKEASVLSSFRERYTAVRRLALSSSTSSSGSVNDSKSSQGGGGVGSSKTVCIEVQFIGPQPSQGPGALLCNLLSGTAVEARPIELRRRRDNKRKRRDSGSDAGSDPEVENEGKSVGPKVFRHRNTFDEKKASFPTQDISSHHDDTVTYVKASDELEQVRAPLIRPVYLTPLSLKGLESFPSHLSTPLNEIPPSTPPSEIPPSSPPSDVLVLPHLTSGTDALPLLALRNDAPPPALAPPIGVAQPSSNTRNNGVPPPPSTLMPSDVKAAPTPPRNGAPLPSSSVLRNIDGVSSPPTTLRNNVSGSCSSTPSTSNSVTALPDTRMHWEDVICRINAPQRSRGDLERQHSLDLIGIGPSRDGGDVHVFRNGHGDGEDDDGTDEQTVSTRGGCGKKSEDNEENTTAAPTAAVVAKGRDHHLIGDNNSVGIGGCISFYEPPLTFDLADELLDPPPSSVHRQGLPTESIRPFSCARGILRGTSFQYTDHIGLDGSISSTYGGMMEADMHKDRFPQQSRDGGGLESVGFYKDDSSAGNAHLVSSSTPALVSCGATGQPNVVVGLVREGQECDFEGHHLPSMSTHSSFSRGHYQVVITGLESVGDAPQNLITTAHFFVDPSHKVGRRASPIRVGANGKSHAALFYPSMYEIWPEVSITSNVRTVEVDVTVDIRSRDGTFQHTTPNLKVMYRRALF